MYHARKRGGRDWYPWWYRVGVGRHGASAGIAAATDRTRGLVVPAVSTGPHRSRVHKYNQISAVTGRSPVSPQAATPAWHHPDDVVSERILEVINFPLDGINLFVRLADAFCLPRAQYAVRQSNLAARLAAPLAAPRVAFAALGASLFEPALQRHLRSEILR